MSTKTKQSNRKKSAKNSNLLPQKCDKDVPRDDVRGQEIFKVPAVPQNADKKQETFEFKFPTIPQPDQKNVIPTGAQIPRTPVKPIQPPDEVVVKNELCYVPSSKGENCQIGDVQAKNFIPKGKEIPRTPAPCYKFLSLSSTRDTKSLPDVNLGVLPLGDIDEVDMKIQESILTGKINIRKKVSNTNSQGNSSKGKDKAERRENTSLPLNLKSSADVLSCENTSEDLAKEVKTKCIIQERSPLSELCNSKEVIRRNPERKARRRPNYKF